MEIVTKLGESVESELVTDYFNNLVNQIFKILPMRENEESSLPVYLRSLQIELLGCGEFVPELKNNHSFLSILSIMQYIITEPECSVKDVRREVFKAISLCTKLRDMYLSGGNV